MNDLASILKTASKKLDSFPVDKQREILDLVEELTEMQNKEQARKEFLPFVRAMWPSFTHGRHHEIMAEGVFGCDRPRNYWMDRGRGWRA